MHNVGQETNPAKQRVIEELEQLSDRVTKLVKFTLSEKFTELTSDMKALMQDQVNVMLQYGDLLRRRLAIWDKTEEELRSWHKLM